MLDDAIDQSGGLEASRNSTTPTDMATREPPVQGSHAFDLEDVYTYSTAAAVENCQLLVAEN